MVQIVRYYGPLVVALAFLFVLLRYGLSLLWPFFLALAIAVLIDPFVDRVVQYTRMPRSLAVAVVLALIFVILALVVTLIALNLLVEIQRLVAELPRIVRTVESLIRMTAEWYGQWFTTLPNVIQDELLKRQNDWITSASQALEALALTLQRVLELPTFILLFILSLIAAYFLSRDREAVINGVLIAVPPSVRPRVRSLLVRLTRSFVGFTNALIVLVSITTVVTIGGLYLIGARYAVIVGLFSGLLDVIPVLGPGLLFLPWALYNVLFGNLMFALQLLILYAVIVVARLMLEPRIIGGQIGLHPLVVLFSLYLGVRWLGPIGFIAGPFVAVFIKALREVGIWASDQPAEPPNANPPQR